MQLRHIYRPITYFAAVFILTFIFGFFAASVSYQKGMESVQLVCMLLGLFSPCAVALAMIYGSGNEDLKKDFWDRFTLNLIKKKYVPIVLLLMPCTLFVATALSLFLGQSSNQFSLSHEGNVMQGRFLLGILFIFLAPLVEELGWRGYGVDSIRQYTNLFNTSIIFGILWGLWHLPLFFINGYYQQVLWNTNIFYVINFFASIFPVTFLLNWVYYKNNRSITIAILFHFTLDLFSVLFQTTQVTKCLITVLLLIVSVVIIMRDKKFFFTRSFYVD